MQNHQYFQKVQKDLRFAIDAIPRLEGSSPTRAFIQIFENWPLMTKNWAVPRVLLPINFS
jgi:hypothetical protein